MKRKILLSSILLLTSIISTNLLKAKASKKKPIIKGHPIEVQAKLKKQYAKSDDKEANKDIKTILKIPADSMDFNQAYRAKLHYEKENQNDLVIKYAERMVSLATEQDLTSEAMIQLAQLYLDQGDLKKAQKHAEDYQTLYPGTDKARDAGYIQLKSSFLSMLDPDRDQTATNKTIELAQNFLDKYKHNKDDESEKLNQSIKDIVNTCYTQLIDSEIGVIKTYLARHNYTSKTLPLKAAQERVAYIKEKLLPNNLKEEPRIIDIEIQLAKVSKDNKLLKDKENELNNKYPKYALNMKSTSFTLKLKDFIGV